MTDCSLITFGSFQRPPNSRHIAGQSDLSHREELFLYLFSVLMPPQVLFLRRHQDAKQIQKKLFPMTQIGLSCYMPTVWRTLEAAEGNQRAVRHYYLATFALDSFFGRFKLTARKSSVCSFKYTWVEDVVL